MRVHNVQIYQTKEDVPEKYLESIFKLIQASDREYQPFGTAKLEFYRKIWKVPELSWVRNLRFIGTDENDEIVGYAWLGWNIKFDNLEQCWHYIHLKDDDAKEYNRTAMFKEIVRNLPEQIKSMYAWHLDETKQEKFYDKFNKKQAYEELLFIADLEKQDLDSVSLEAQNQREKALEKGYDIIFVEGVDYRGHVEDYSKFVKLIECVWNDMPTEELTEENTKLTVERYDEQCKHNQMNFETFLAYIAIEKETKDPVGITVSVIGKYQPHVAWQWETGVLHEHRGNGLGLALKYRMLEKLLKIPDVKYWSTGSASVNVYMHRINEILGYKKWNSEIVYEFTKEELNGFIKSL